MSNHIAARFSVRLDPNDISQTHSSPDKRVHFIAPEYENTRLVRSAKVCMHFFCLQTSCTEIDISYHIAARLSVRTDPNDIFLVRSLLFERVIFFAPEYENTRFCTTRVLLALISL